MDFTGFYFKNHHSSEFGITKVSNGSRYQEDLLPTSEDYTADIPGSDGQYNFGSNYKTKEFNLNFAFDNVSELQIRKMRGWLSKKETPVSEEMGDLIFDETPYKRYVVKTTGNPQINYICFEEEDKETSKTKRVYKGEGTINFTCYNSYAFNSYYKSLDEYRYQIEGVNLFDISLIVHNGMSTPLEETPIKLVYQNYGGRVLDVGDLPLESNKTYYYKYYMMLLEDLPGEGFVASSPQNGLAVTYRQDSQIKLLWLRETGDFSLPKKNQLVLHEGTITTPSNIDEFGLYSYCRTYRNSETEEIKNLKIAFSYITISEEPIKPRYSTLEEWAESSMMLDDLTEYNNYDSVTKTVKLYNAGDLETDWKMTFSKPIGAFSERTFSLSTSDESFSISVSPSSTEEGLTTASLENEIANLNGIIEIDTKKNMVTFISEDGKRVPAYFLIKKGSLFKIPSSLFYNNILMNISGEVLSDVTINYDYLYY